MIYEFYRGRRDSRALRHPLSVGRRGEVFHAVHSLGLAPLALRRDIRRVDRGRDLPRLHHGHAAARRKSSGFRFRRELVICGRRLRLILLYLLHQQIGYALFVRMAPANAKLGVTAIILGIWLRQLDIWRYVERPLQSPIRNRLTGWAARRGWPSKPKLVAHSNP